MALAAVAVPAALSSHGAARDKNPAWSPDGALIAFNTGASPEQIWTARPDGTGHRRISRGGVPDVQPAWSRDGRRIAFASMPAGSWDVYVADADGSNRVPVVTSPSDDTAPAWSPDGSQIAYQRADDSGRSSEIRVVNADGSGDRRLTSGGRNEAPSWSPDGARIAFSSSRAGNLDLYVMDADGTDVRRLTATPARREDEPVWSPDGEEIAFAAGSDHVPRDVYVIAADGSGERRVTRLGRSIWHPSWSPDGARIAFFEFPFPSAAIHLVNADGSGLTRLFGRLAFAGLALAPSPPLAGRTFSATLRVTGSGTGVTVSCRASAAGRALRLLSTRFASGRARCTWAVPRSAKGKRLAGTIAAAERGSRVVRRFSLSVR